MYFRPEFVAYPYPHPNYTFFILLKNIFYGFRTKLNLNRHDQTISKKSFGFKSSMSGFSMLMTPAG